jgi:hypothetical protein
MGKMHGTGPAARLDSTRNNDEGRKVFLQKASPMRELHAGICAGALYAFVSTLSFIYAQITLEAGSVLFGISYLRNGIYEVSGQKGISDPDAVLLEQASVVCRSVLDTPVGVMDQFWCLMPLPQSHAATGSDSPLAFDPVPSQ